MKTLTLPIRLIRVSFFALALAYLCLSTCPGWAAEVHVMLSAQEWFDRGRFMGEIGNYRKAVEAFSRVIELAPDSAHAYNNRGVAYSELGNYRLAIQDYNRAIGIDPDEAMFRFNRGIAFGRGGEYDMAIEDFKRVIEMDPQHTHARFFLGLIQRSMPKEAYRGTDNIKSSARLGNKDAREYLRSRLMGGWY
ncbi:MAG: tetratricopeptide repeat protein [Syntrophales bacterium]